MAGGLFYLYLTPMKREGYIEIDNMCNSRVRYVITSKGRSVSFVADPPKRAPANLTIL